MSLKFVDHFVYQNGSYDCYYDTGSNTGVVQFSGTGAQQRTVPIPNPGRGYNEGDLINSFCSDNPSTTKVTCYATANNPFFTFELQQNSPDCTYVPPVGVCDAAINSINVSNESAQDAKDGAATINASSSVGGLQYSLDGASYRSGNTFNKLAPNTYTAYIKDTNGCAATQRFTVLAYNNPVQNFAGSLPVVTIPTDNISRWNAAFNPTVINYQRKDFVVTSVTRYSDTQVRAVIQNGLTSDQYTAAINSGIYLKTDKYEFTGNADAYDNGLILTLTYFADDLNPGFVNVPILKQNFFVETEITSGLDVEKTVIVAQHSPNLKGATRADISAYLQTLLTPVDGYDYLASVYRDLSLAGSYTLRYREVWDGAASNWYAGPYALYYTYAAMQLQEQYGGNMAAYVPFLNALPRYKAQWLTDMETPTMWLGLPYEMAFIYSEYLLGKDLFLEVSPDSGDTVEGLLLNADNGYITSADTSRILIERINTVGYPIRANIGVNRVLIPQAGLQNARTAAINLYYTDDSGNKVYVMQPKTIRVDKSCNDPYVYLKWINHLGAYDYWRFGYNQALTSTSSSSQQISRYVLDWANGDTIEDYISRNANDKMTLYAGGVDKASLKGLRCMNNSIKCQMLTNSSLYKWQTVSVGDGDFSVYNTRAQGADVQIDIVLPGKNVQGQ